MRATRPGGAAGDPRADVRDICSGICATGTPQHFAGELYRSMANINIVHIPYRGCAPVLTDVLGGQVTIAMINGSLAADIPKYAALVKQANIKVD